MVWWYEIKLWMGRFTRSNFDPINIENFCVHDGICWCSHDPVVALNYFVTSSKNFSNSRFENFMSTSPQIDPAVTAIFLKYFARSSMGKLRIGGSFDPNWMKIEHALFSSNTGKLLETCQKLALTRPIVVWKIGLKNNWMQKLDRVDLP